MGAPELERSVRKIVAEQIALASEDVQLSSRLDEDLGIVGDDLCEILQRLAREHSVDLSGYRWFHHTEPEGAVNPFYLLFKPWWARASRIPLRVADLVAAAEKGVWTIEYPQEEVTPRLPLADVLLWLFLAALLLAGLVGALR